MNVFYIFECSDALEDAAVLGAIAGVGTAMLVDAIEDHGDITNVISEHDQGREGGGGTLTSALNYITGSTF